MPRYQQLHFTGIGAVKFYEIMTALDKEPHRLKESSLISNSTPTISFKPFTLPGSTIAYFRFDGSQNALVGDKSQAVDALQAVLNVFVDNADASKLKCGSSESFDMEGKVVLADPDCTCFNSNGNDDTSCIVGPSTFALLRYLEDTESSSYDVTQITCNLEESGTLSFLEESDCKEIAGSLGERVPDVTVQCMNNMIYMDSNCSSVVEVIQLGTTTSTTSTSTTPTTTSAASTALITTPTGDCENTQVGAFCGGQQYIQYGGLTCCPQGQDCIYMDPQMSRCKVVATTKTNQNNDTPTTATIAPATSPSNSSDAQVPLPTTTTTETAVATTIDPLAYDDTPASTIEPLSSPSKGAVIGGVLIGVLILVTIILVCIYWRRRKEGNVGNNGIPHLNGTLAHAATATTHNQMYDQNNQNNNAATTTDNNTNTTTTTTTTDNNATGFVRRNSTLYSIPMESSVAGSGGGASADAAATCTDANGNPVEKGTVMYVSVLNQDSPEYATAVANDALYSVVSKGGAAGNDANTYDTAVHQNNGTSSSSAPSSSSAEYNHLSARGDSTNYGVAVHQNNGTPSSSAASSSSAEYSRMPLHGTASAQALVDGNNHYDVGNPHATRKNQNNHYDVGNPYAKKKQDHSSVA